MASIKIKTSSGLVTLPQYEVTNPDFSNYYTKDEIDAINANTGEVGSRIKDIEDALAAAIDFEAQSY